MRLALNLPFLTTVMSSQEVEHLTHPPARALFEQHLESIQQSVDKPDVQQVKEAIQARMGNLQAWIAYCRRQPNIVPNLPALI